MLRAVSKSPVYAVSLRTRYTTVGRLSALVPKFWYQRGIKKLGRGCIKKKVAGTVDKILGRG